MLIKPEKVAVCATCPLRSQPFVPSVGPEDAELMFVGEAPAWNEVRMGEPFVGRAGEEFNAQLQEAHLRRSDIFIANALKCQIPQGTPKSGPLLREAIDHCRERLKVEIRRLNPTAIVALGDIALRSLTGKSGISRVRGSKQPLQPLLREYLINQPIVIPTFHPAYILRGKAAFRRICVKDIETAIAAASGEPVKPQRAVSYHCVDKFGRVVWFLRYLKQYTKIAFDTETTGWDAKRERVVADQLNYQQARIFMMSFSVKAGEAWALPLEGHKGTTLWNATQLEYIWKRLRRLFENPRITWVLQNAPFDLRLLHQKGIRVDRMQYRDLMTNQALCDENTPKDLESMALLYTDMGNIKQESKTEVSEALRRK